jgi:uncharacterized membrane protein YczE
MFPMQSAPSVRPTFLRAATVGRLGQLVAGLVLFGVGVALMVQSGLGLGPWDVLHQGLSRVTGIPIGTMSILVGIPVLAAWYPLRVRPGLGTLMNFVLIGVATNVTLGIVPAASAGVAQAAALVVGLGCVGFGSGLYLAAGYGPGPRDGLMTGIHRRWGPSLAATRIGLELSALAAGFVLGGTVGIGTVAFALGIGPAIQATLRVVDREGRVLRRSSSVPIPSADGAR